MQQQQGEAKVTRILSQGMPDQTIHQPPGAMAVLGWMGVIAGFLTNGWQGFTTVLALWTMFFAGSTTVPWGDFGDVVFDACLLIAFSFQSALFYLVFRIDTRWKRQQTGRSGKKNRGMKGYGHAAVEVVQQFGLFGIWIGLAFVIDTLGDYMFIASHTGNADPTTSAFLIFLYAVALYALSTIAFVRAWEYLWAASAVKDQWKAAREEQWSRSRRGLL